MIEFEFEPFAWDLAMKQMKPGDSLPAVRCLALLEDMSDDEVEVALMTLEEKGIRLDVSDLPKDAGQGEAALRLQQEQRLAESGQLVESLSENDALRIYMQELAEMPEAGDVDTLAQAYLAGDDEAAKKLADVSLKTVISRVLEMTGRGVLLLDLIQEGSLGLWQGILHYKGGDFAKHILWWIDQYLAKAVLLQARASGVGEKMRTGLSDYRDVDKELLSQLGRNPTIEEIAEALHITVEEAAVYEAMLNQARNRQRIDAERAPKEEEPDDNQQVENTAYFQERQRVLEMLSTLTEQEMKVIVLRFGLEGGLPLTPEQTAEKLGVALNDVRKMERTALRKMRGHGQ